MFLQLEGIAHKRTRVSRPQSNGVVERLHRTLLDASKVAELGSKPSTKYRPFSTPTSSPTTLSGYTRAAA
jgi:transposase InsO family protein